PRPQRSALQLDRLDEVGFTTDRWERTLSDHLAAV
ncbi:MAG: hypothetical protein JWR64_2431, partial [Marmoricola sp.]|nr:hypothetical protein [Marmoricola sp.]